MLRLLPHLTDKKAVIFDYNGTILYDTDLCVEALNHLRATHDLTPFSEADYRRQFQFPIMSFYEQIGFDFEKESFDQLGVRYIEHYVKNLHRCAVYEGLRDLLKELQKRQIKTAILTALNQDLLMDQLSIFDLNGYFSATFGLPDHRAHSKIERGRELIEHLGVCPSETIVVGDTLHDLEVAEALGAEALLLADGHQDEERLRQRHQRVVHLDRKVES